MTLAAILVGFDRLSSEARAQGLIADLSHHLVAITTGFVGSNVLLFGAVDEPGSAVAVVVKGPSSTASVWRKDRIGPIWINRREVQFKDVPEYYAVATSLPLEELTDAIQLKRHEIGVENLRLPHVLDSLDPEEDLDAFREAFIRNKERDGLYAREPSTVRFLGDRLFRTTITLPANVPPGSYFVETFEIQNQIVMHAQTTVLTVSKVGMEAEIYSLANDRAALYGVISIALAVTAGWTASAIFRRR